MPAKDDPTAAYTMYFKDGFDPYGESTYPGDLGVFVDRHTGVAKDFYGTPGESMAQSLYDGSTTRCTPATSSTAGGG